MFKEKTLILNNWGEDVIDVLALGLVTPSYCKAYIFFQFGITITYPNCCNYEKDPKIYYKLLDFSNKFFIKDPQEDIL